MITGCSTESRCHIMADVGARLVFFPIWCVLSVVFVWVWHLVSHIKGRTYAEGVRE